MLCLPVPVSTVNTTPEANGMKEDPLVELARADTRLSEGVLDEDLIYSTKVGKFDRSSIFVIWMGPTKYSNVIDLYQHSWRLFL